MATPQQIDAAIALTRALKDNGIDHAYIGGFAVNLLGIVRATADVDVQINMSVRDSFREKVDKVLNIDPRFTRNGLKLVFHANSNDGSHSNAPADAVLIETLPMGELGLPTVFKLWHDEQHQLPVLHPTVLILTKIKRIATLLDSTRPKTVSKATKDELDIMELVHWHESNSEKVDFSGYGAVTVERLYTATRALSEKWRKTSEGDKENWFIRLRSIVKDEDWAKVMSA